MIRLTREKKASRNTRRVKVILDIYLDTAEAFKRGSVSLSSALKVHSILATVHGSVTKAGKIRYLTRY